MDQGYLDVQAVRRILAAGSGDAALLYLCRTCGLSDVVTGFSEARLTEAERLLRQLGAQQPDAPRYLKGADERPEYSDNDVAAQLEPPQSPFRRLVGEVQRYLGKALSTEELKILLSMYQYLGLPTEVINMLVHYCVDRGRSRGSGRTPSMRNIEREAYRWADAGIDTMERAAAFIQSQLRRESRSRQITELLGIQGRVLTPGEEKYIQTWADWGFTDEVLRLAYDKTCMNTGALKWPYMHSILKSWNAQGLTTVEQISARDRKPGAPLKAGKGDFQRHGQALSPMMKQAVARMMQDEQED